MEEMNHVIDVLTRARRAIENEDALELKNLSDQTIHAASVYQHTDYMLVAVNIYALSKVIEKKEKFAPQNWRNMIKNITNLISLAISSLQDKKQGQFIKFLNKIKQTLSDNSGDMSPLIHEVLRKASINKASKVYEHGISLAKTTKLLGISAWEISEYIGEKENPHISLNQTIDVKKRASMAMEFFS